MEEKEENVCEHGDHLAPVGQRFCSKECERCECESKNGCDGICLAPPAPGADGGKAGT